MKYSQTNRICKSAICTLSLNLAFAPKQINLSRAKDELIAPVKTAKAPAEANQYSLRLKINIFLPPYETYIVRGFDNRLNLSSIGLAN